MISFVDCIKWFYKRKSEREIYHNDDDDSGDGSDDGGGGGSDDGGIGGYYDVTDHDDMSQDNRCCH